ncbi:MAG: phage portal protein [Candidatus Diapherotrites archaeon]|nr:phage portal protein [Candidatus Diapherotrites archaeon]
MKTISSDEALIERASKSWLKHWYGSYTEPPKKGFSPQVPIEKQPSVLFDMYKFDATVFGTVNTFVNKTISNGYGVKGKNKQLVEAGRKKLDDLDFEIILPNVLRNMVVYGDAFMELEYEGETVIALHIPETTEMEILSDEHGDVVGYQQRHGGKDPVNFSVDEMIHFSWLDFGSRLFGMTPMETLKGIVITKKYAESFNKTKFQNYAPRMAWLAKNASNEQVEQLIDSLTMAKDNPHKDIVVQGDIEFKPLMETSDDVNFIELQRFLREQILMTLQVPPIMMGLPDNSNRSNSEAQMRAFESNVRSLQRPVEHCVTKNLFPLLGLKNLVFRFSPLDKRNEKEDLEIAAGLKELGVDDQTILEFLKDAGLKLREGVTIKKPEPMMGTGILRDEAGRKKETLKEPMKAGEDSETRDEQLRSFKLSMLNPYFHNQA